MKAAAVFSGFEFRGDFSQPVSDKGILTLSVEPQRDAFPTDRRRQVDGEADVEHLQLALLNHLNLVNLERLGEQQITGCKGMSMSPVGDGSCAFQYVHELPEGVDPQLSCVSGGGFYEADDFHFDGISQGELSPHGSFFSPSEQAVVGGHSSEFAAFIEHGDHTIY